MESSERGADRLQSTLGATGTQTGPTSGFFPLQFLVQGHLLPPPSSFAELMDSPVQTRQQRTQPAAQADQPHGGADEDLQVENRGGRADVLQIEGEFLADAIHRRIGREIDLSHPRNPRSNGVPVIVAIEFLGQRRDELRPLGTRADDPHIAPNDVPELREFIEVQMAKPPPDRGDATVILRRPNGASSGFGVADHAPQFVEPERLAAPADSGLGKYGRPGGGESNERAECDDDRRSRNQQRRREQTLKRVPDAKVAGPMDRVSMRGRARSGARSRSGGNMEMWRWRG